ncbi:MAG: Rne/Rng family ribonuclease [Porphyromonas sp.]|nr:Rne/Rng family ribonuclease [Porphyromonas sp.]
MKSELIIDVQPKEVSIAVLEDKRLVELQQEKQNIEFSVGDVYLGKVKKIMPGLNAAFVDIGHKKEAFLHYRDLGSCFLSAQSFLEAHSKYGKNFSPERVKLEKEIDKDGSISDRLKPGDEVLVEITKEAISTKGPRLSAELSFAGRYLVLLPFSDKVSVSNKIRKAEERNRLKQLILSIKPKNVTVIVRTSAEGVKVAELDHELRMLVKRWNNTIANISKKKTSRILYKESSRTLSLLRDTYSSTFTDIYINDKDLVEETRDYIELIDPGKGSIVKLYKDSAPIFDSFDVTRQIKHLFGKTVTYKSGAYLVIEQTEAMHVIDVNSGNRAKGSNQQEDTAIDVNLSAAEEIARQLRLRDIGGIIVIDFIDMGQAANRQKLFEKMNEYMKNDRAKHTVLPITKFGLMQITRQRVRQALAIETEETCPTCRGTGQVQPSLFFTDELKKFALHVHPYVAAYIQKRKGLVGLGSSLYTKWRAKYGKGLTIIPDESLGMLSYEFYDSENDSLSHFLEE